MCPVSKLRSRASSCPAQSEVSVLLLELPCLHSWDGHPYLRAFALLPYLMAVAALRTSPGLADCQPCPGLSPCEQACHLLHILQIADTGGKALQPWWEAVLKSPALSTPEVPVPKCCVWQSRLGR